MEEDINKLQKFIDNCKNCKFATCEQCEINWTEVQALQNLIARYKEVEDKNKTLETLLQGNLYQMYLYYKELAGRYQANSISKDKVKEKKKELDDKDLEIYDTDSEDVIISKYEDRAVLDFCNSILED